MVHLSHVFDVNLYVLIVAFQRYKMSESERSSRLPKNQLSVRFDVLNSSSSSSSSEEDNIQEQTISGVNHGRRRLYAALRSQPYGIASFDLDPVSGRLSALGVGPLPESTPYIALDRSGDFLLWASYSGHKIGVNAIGSDGLVRGAHQVIGTLANAHAIVADPSGRYFFVPCLGGDAVMQWRFDAKSGMLSPNATAMVTQKPGAGPRHLEFHADGRHAYLLNELDASVTSFAFDPGSGRLAQRQNLKLLASDFRGKPWAADIHLTPDGRFLYASERRSSTLTQFSVAADGRIERVANYATETEPRSFAIDASGRFLLVLGQASASMTSYAIDSVSGRLAELQKFPLGRNPAWVEIVRLS